MSAISKWWNARTAIPWKHRIWKEADLKPPVVATLVELREHFVQKLVGNY
jgi:hypothetical protein